MTHFTPTHPTARTRHTCIACYHPIEVGERYTQQEGFAEDGRYRCRYHAECFNALVDESYGGTFEFCPGECEPPARLL